MVTGTGIKSPYKKRSYNCKLHIVPGELSINTVHLELTSVYNGCLSQGQVGEGPANIGRRIQSKCRLYFVNDLARGFQHFEWREKLEMNLYGFCFLLCYNKGRKLHTMLAVIFT